MGSGKRASMREGPLAALFRKTETGARAARGAGARARAAGRRPSASPPGAAHADAAGAPAPRILLRPAGQHHGARRAPPASSPADYRVGRSRARPVGASPSCAWSASAAAA